MIAYSSHKPKREFTPNYIGGEIVRNIKVSLSEKDYDKLAYKAATEGFNVSSLLRSLVQNYINGDQ